MKYISILFLSSFFFNFYSNAQQLAHYDKQQFIELSKEIFPVDAELSFVINSKDLKSSFEQMDEEDKFDKDYLNKAFNELKFDSLNPILINNIAEYYSKINEINLAQYYYKKAFSNIDFEYFNGDSAFFYSFRGILKANLNDSTGLFDLERSIEINPSDSIAVFFYPMALLGQGKFEKAKEVSIYGLQKESEYKSIFYISLVMSELLKNLQETSRVGNDLNYREEIVKLDYNQIIDYTTIDEFHSKYEGDIEIDNCRIMADILGLFFKMMTFEKNSKNQVIRNYSEFEKSKMKEIITQLKKRKRRRQINVYTYNKCLGFVYFLSGQKDVAISYLRKAVEIFPKSKKDSHFNSTSCKDAITSIYFRKGDTITFKKLLTINIKKEQNKTRKINYLEELAKFSLITNDIKNVKGFCEKIRDIDSENITAYRLLSHLSFISDSKFLSGFYAQKASERINNDEDYVYLILQSAIYQIYYGQKETAKANIEIVKNLPDSPFPDLCDKLLAIIK